MAEFVKEALGVVLSVCSYQLSALCEKQICILIIHGLQTTDRGPIRPAMSIHHYWKKT